MTMHVGLPTKDSNPYKSDCDCECWVPPHCFICGLKEGTDHTYPTQTDKLGWVHLSCMKDKFEYESTK